MHNAGTETGVADETDSDQRTGKRDERFQSVGLDGHGHGHGHLEASNGGERV